MPALVPVSGVMRVVVNQVLAGIPVINVFHVQKQTTGQWLQADAQSLVNLMRSSWVTNIIPRQCNVLSLGNVVGTDLTTDLGVVAASNGSTPGGQPGGVMPANVAMCVGWPIPRHYRGGHPRTYFGGVPLGDASNANSWIGSAITAWTSAAAAWRTAVNALVLSDSATIGLVCVHRYKKSLVTPTNPKGAIPTPFVDFLGAPSVDTRIDSQRRRLGRDR